MHSHNIPKTTTVESLWDGSVVLVGGVGVGEETLGTVVLVVALLDAEITLGQSVNTKDIHVTTCISICYLLDYHLEVELELVHYSRHHYHHTPCPSEYRHPS